MNEASNSERERWLERYHSDPAFRLERLKKLALRHPKKYGSPGPRDNPYEHDIKAAKAAIAADRNKG
jgi:hypothetical protein